MVEQELGHLGASVNLRTVLRGASLDQTRERCCAHPATAATERRLGPALGRGGKKKRCVLRGSSGVQSADCPTWKSDFCRVVSPVFPLLPGADRLPKSFARVLGQGDAELVVADIRRHAARRHCNLALQLGNRVDTASSCLRFPKITLYLGVGPGAIWAAVSCSPPQPAHATLK